MPGAVVDCVRPMPVCAGAEIAWNWIIAGESNRQVGRNCESVRETIGHAQTDDLRKHVSEVIFQAVAEQMIFGIPVLITKRHGTFAFGLHPRLPESRRRPARQQPRRY